MRRSIRGLLAVALAMLAAPATASPVQIDGGLIDGQPLDDGLIGYFGVPFAAPPVRDLRWKAPQPVAPWQGVRHADRFAPMCLQPLRSRTMNHYFGNEATSEDCLYLNIWAPANAAPTGTATTDAHGLPVVVWVYGGGFNVGSASMANYAGAGLARDGVIQVNIAYRVGPMGFLAHPDLSREGGGHSGNYGLMDQVAALEWVHRNIAAFGGDPSNVTIMGQSAGSMSVALLQMNPRARGLFHRIVAMSGSPFGGLMGPMPLAEAEQQGIALQQALGASSIEAMRDLPGDRILAIAPTVPRMPLVIDGANITGTAEQVFAAHQQNDVPVMLGITRDERFVNLGPASTVAQYQAVVRAAFPDTADPVLAAYPVRDDAGVQRALVDLMRDSSVGKQMFDWASANALDGTSPTYAYFFTRRQPYAAGISFVDHDPATVGAYHTGEVPYFLRNLDSLNLFRSTRNWSDADRQLSAAMSGMILRFVRGQAPAANWPAFDPARPRMMQLDLDRAVIDWPHAATLPLLRARTTTPVATAARPRD